MPRSADRSSVLRCGPGDHESRLSFAGLRDLLERVYDDTAGRLPTPQRRALAVALLREEPDGDARQRCRFHGLPDLPPRALAHRTRDGGRGRRSVARPTDGFRARVRPPSSPRRACRIRARAPVYGSRACRPRARSCAVTRSIASRHPWAAKPRRAPGDASSSPGPFVAAAPPASHPRELRTAIPSSRSRSRRALERDGTSPGSALPVPQDLEELLRARIDALPDDAASGPPGRVGVVPADAGAGCGGIWVGSGCTRCHRGGRTGGRRRDPSPPRPVHAPVYWRRRSMRVPRQTNAERSIEPSLTSP